MDIETPKGLEIFAANAQSALELALQEREELGLSIPSLRRLWITHFDPKDTPAAAWMTNEGPCMRLNASLNVWNQLHGNDRTMLVTLMNYFKMVGEFLGHQSEDTIIAFINSPAESIRELEMKFRQEDYHTLHQNGLAQKFIVYKGVLDYAARKAPAMKNIYHKLLPKINQASAFSGIESFRHELDHADFFASKIYTAYQHKTTEAIDILKLLQQPKLSFQDVSTSDHLEAMIYSDTLVELRALFFNFIGKNGWKSADYNIVNKQVYGTFIKEYIEHFYLQSVFDRVVVDCSLMGLMDSHTYTYLSSIIKAESTPHLELDKVNYKNAAMILYELMPRWKALYADCAESAVYAIGDAYKSDPSRLKNANMATTFSEFLNICTGH